MLSLSSGNCAKFATELHRANCQPSSWTNFRWACRMTLKWRSEKARLACGWGQRFLGTGQNLNHRGHRGHREKPGSTGCEISSVSSVTPVVKPFDVSNKKLARRSHLRRQSPPTRQEERHHRQSRAYAEGLADRPSG